MLNISHVATIWNFGAIHLRAEISGQAGISVSGPEFRPGILAWKKQAENFGLEFQARIPREIFRPEFQAENSTFT